MRPNASPSAAIASTCFASQAGASRTLMNPGGATSTAAIPSLFGTRSAIAFAISSGGRRSGLARRSATFAA